MIKPGIETLIQPQLNDPIIDKLSKYFTKLQKLERQYRINNSINRKEYEISFKSLRDEFDKIIYDRFNFHIDIKPFNTFAVLPIINEDTLKNSKGNVYLGLKNDVKKAYRQIKQFAAYIEDHEVIIDRKRAKFINFKDSWSITYFYEPNWLEHLTGIEFTTITLHEIGHVFTLIEMYSLTNKQIYSLLESFLSIDPMKQLSRKLAITKNKNKNKEADVTIMLYDNLNKPISDNILVIGRENNNEDNEYQADDFVAKFGLGGELSKTLVKISDTQSATYTNLSIILILDFILLTTLITVLLAPIGVIPILIIISLVSFIIKLVSLISSLLNSTDNRNPTGDVHGSFLERIKSIKYGTISILRTVKLTKEETKAILTQLDYIESSAGIVEKSIFNSLLGSVVNKLLAPNLNIRDELADLLRSTIDNDLYVKQARFGVGIENRIADIKPNVYIYNNIYFSGWISILFKQMGPIGIKNINDILEEYGIYIEMKVSNDDTSFVIRSLNDINISDGVSTIAFISKNNSDTILTLTMDMLKIKYQLENPLITIYNIQKVKATDNKYIYIMEVDRLKHIKDSDDISEKRKDEIYNLISDIRKFIKDRLNNYGDALAGKMLPLLISSNIKNLDIIRPQLVILNNLIKELPIDTYGSLDITDDNLMLNKKGDVVVTDPIYYPYTLAAKTNNDIDLTKYNFSK